MIPARCSSHLNRLLSMKRNSGFIVSSSQMVELHTLTLRKNPGHPAKEAACVCDLIHSHPTAYGQRQMVKIGFRKKENSVFFVFCLKITSFRQT